MSVVSQIPKEMMDVPWFNESRFQSALILLKRGGYELQGFEHYEDLLTTVVLTDGGQYPILISEDIVSCGCKDNTAAKYFCKHLWVATILAQAQGVDIVPLIKKYIASHEAFKNE